MFSLSCAACKSDHREVIRIQLMDEMGPVKDNWKIQ